MGNSVLQRGWKYSLVSGLEKIPIISFYVKTRGWYFVISWLHRITGILLLFFIGLHIYSLSFLYDPGVYNVKMQIYKIPLLAFFEWALAIPVIFHAINGGRLVLFEIFGYRNDELMISWVMALSLIYILIFSCILLLGNQTVSPFFFWLIVLVIALILVYEIISRIWDTDHSLYWKLQRITGAFLIIMVPAHLLFMHLNPLIAKEADTVVLRMKSLFIRVVDAVLLLTALYHGGYGIISFIKDVFPPGITRNFICALIAIAIGIFVWIGIKLTLTL